MLNRILKEWLKDELTIVELNALAVIIKDMQEDYFKLTNDNKISKEILMSLETKGYIIGYWNKFPILHKKILDKFNLIIPKVKETKSNTAKEIKKCIIPIDKLKSIAKVIYDWYPYKVITTDSSAYTTRTMLPNLIRRLKDLITQYPEYTNILVNCTELDVQNAIKEYCGIQVITPILRRKLGIVTAANFIGKIEDAKKRIISDSMLINTLDKPNKVKPVNETEEGLLG